MIGKETGRFVMAALALTAAPPLLAQPTRGTVLIDRRNIAISFRPQDEAIQIPCCRCIDGGTTVLNVSTGTAPWTVIPPASSTAALADPATHSAWASLSPANWVGSLAGAAGPHVYTVRFVVPTCVIQPQIIIGGAFAADNDGRLHVDPYPAAIAATPLVTGFQPASVTYFSRAITGPGSYALRVVVQNNEGPVGLILRGTITVTCPNDPVAPTDPTRAPLPDRQ